MKRKVIAKKYIFADQNTYEFFENQNTSRLNQVEQLKLDSNILMRGDNLHVLKSIPSESFDLIYIDPPFFTERKLTAKVKNSTKQRSFEDTWDSLEDFMTWLNVRFVEMRRLLKKTGNLVVHLDHHATHYAKVELDKIFGRENFQNEIIWSYRTGGASKRRFAAKHDNLLWYSKDSEKYFFKLIKERVYYAKPFFNPKQDAQGRYYADVIPVDTWDIKAVINISKERIDYPTQKPEELLAKIITSLCPTNGTVADFFLGGGTTIAVAEKLGRKWFGCDISSESISVTKTRLKNLSSDVGVPFAKSRTGTAKFKII